MDSSEAGSGTGDATPMSAQSLYSALGLSSEDIEALAKIPEKEITVDTLPFLIMQLKAKRAENAKAATDTECSEQTETKQPEEKDEPLEKKSDGSPAKSSELEAPSHDQENPEKNDDEKKADRPSKREDKGRKSSKERQREEDITDEELDDKPTVFPHICSLCKIESNGLKAWHGHLQGMRHSKAKAEYLKLSRRGPRPGKRPYSSEKNSGDPASSDRFYHTAMPSTRVVVAKFPMGCLAVADLLELGKPFGKVVKHLLFPFKGFLEFSSHKIAKEMVSHYQQKPAFIKGSFISLSLSTNVKVIHDPTDFHEPGPKRMKSNQSVVCFSRLPPGKDNEDKVLELAGLFGSVRNSKFSDDKALIEMVDWRDADIMLKYYHSNPLRIQDKSIKVYLSSLPTLSEGSSERSSKRSDSSRSRSSRQKTESSSSKSTAQSSSKDKDKEKDEEEGEKGKEKPEGEKADKKEETLEHEQEAQMEDESSMMETDGAEAISTGMEEEEEKKDCMKTDEEKKAEEKPEQKKNKEKQGSGEDAEEQENLEDMDFPDNLDDFVTLDELDPATDSTDFPDFPEGKVVLVKPILFMNRKDHRSAMIKDLYKLAEPFGKVVNFSISFYKHEAMLELESQEKAREMVTHYRGTRTKLHGRHINININPSLKTIEDPSGRTLFISNIPRFERLEMPLLKTIRPFGKITGYTFSMPYGTCYIQMEKVEEAKSVIDRYSRYPLKFRGSNLKIAKCKKGDSLIFWNSADGIERWFEAQQSKKSERRRENGQTSKGSTGEDRHRSRLEGVCGDPSADDSEDDKMDQTPLSPFEPNKPVGVSYVVSRTGFFCKLCNIFYTDEKRAKSDHCSSLEHYNMLKRKREKVKSKPLPDAQVIKKEKPTEMQEKEQEKEKQEEQVEEQVEAPEDKQQETLDEEEQEEKQIEAQEEEQEEAQEDAEAQEEEEPPQQQEDE